MKLKNLNKLIHLFSLLLIVVGLLGFAKMNMGKNTVRVRGADTCPDGGGWTKLKAVPIGIKI